MSKCNKRITVKQADRLKKLGRESIESALGGMNSISYYLLADYCEYVMLDEFASMFGTRHISKLSVCEYEKAVIFMEEWFPDDKTMEESVLYENAFSKYIYKFCEEPDKNSAAYSQLREDFINAVCSGTKGSR